MYKLFLSIVTVVLKRQKRNLTIYQLENTTKSMSTTSDIYKKFIKY